jgi:hypothetical protein
MMRERRYEQRERRRKILAAQLTVDLMDMPVDILNPLDSRKVATMLVNRGWRK